MCTKKLVVVLGLLFGFSEIAFSQLPNLPTQIPQSPNIEQVPTYDPPKLDPPATIDTSRYEARAAASSGYVSAKLAQPIVAARIVAPPTESEHVSALIQRAGYLMTEIRRLGYTTWLEAGLAAVNHDNQEGGPEEHFREAKEDLNELEKIESELESITHQAQRAAEREQAYINSLPIESASRYVVHQSDGTTTPPPQCTMETKYTYEKRPVFVHFDSNEKPVYRLDYDVVPHRVQECK